MNSDFRLHVLSVIERYQMLSLGDTVIVGLSGGADSMALLSVLNEIKSEYDLTLIAAHVNHGLRGEEALRDEQFAGDFCKSLGIEYRVLHADVPGLAADSGESFEACGRRVRYDFFASIAKEVASFGGNRNDAISTVKIATAHNAQDVVETLLFNLSRGSGLRGLCSIPPKRSFDSVLTSLEIIRPLIDSTRDEIEEYLSRNGIAFVNDSTNFETDYARNRIRLNILPELEKLNPGVVRNIVRCVDSLRVDDAYLSSQAELILNEALMHEDADTEVYNVSVLLSSSLAVRSRAVGKILLDKSGVHPEKSHIDSVCDLLKIGGATQVAGGLYVSVQNGVLKFPPMPGGFTETEDFLTQICLKSDRYTDNLLGAEVSFSVISYDQYAKAIEKNELMWENALDYDKISTEFFLRNRRDGDRFRLPKRHITKTLKNLFNEAKISPEIRSQLLMIESDGELAFLEGFGVSEKYMVTRNTEKVLTIEIVRGNKK